MIIGLTGQTGAGKSSVGIFLDEYGIKVIDCDKLYKELTVKGSSLTLKLVETFGNGILFDDGSLNRKKLASIAFSSKENTELLNSITHPKIISEIKERIRKEKGDVVLDAPTLFESGADGICDKIVSVIADRETRLKRIIERDNITKQQAEERINAQGNDEFYISKSDYVIVNDGNICELNEKTKKVFMSLGVI